MQVTLNPKKFWNFVNMKKKTGGVPLVMKHNYRKSTNIQESCDLFADYFKEVYADSNLNVANIPNINSNSINIGLIKLSIGEVFIAMLHLNKNKGIGSDLVPPLLLIKCAAALCLPLAFLFNLSLSNGVFPKKWKIASITPVFKKGSRNNVSSYRGISILPTLGKLFESLVTDILSAHFRKVITTKQHGFFSGRSTTTNLVEFTNIATKVVESGRQLDVIYTDFTKAFDKINHEILLNKLESLGVFSMLLQWIGSYITGRKQFVNILGWHSQTFHVLSGVPQGSHLGPLLFILYVNDITNVFRVANCLFYADDLKLFATVTSNRDVLELQNDLDALSTWSIANGMKLNVDKCKCMSFAMRREPILASYYIDSIELERVTHMRDLGVWFDEKLSFSRHIECKIAKAFSMLGFMKRICSEFTNVAAIRSIYCAHVRSHLEYASVVWSPAYDVHKIRIESIQKQFLLYALRHKYARNPNFELPSYDSRCGEIELESLEFRRETAEVLFVHGVLLNYIDSEYILSQIHFNVPGRNLRAHDFLKLSYHRTNYGSTEPITRACRAFNKIVSCFNFNISRIRFRSEIVLR